MPSGYLGEGRSDKWYQPAEECSHTDDDTDGVCKQCDPDGYADYIADLRYSATRDGECPVCGVTE